MTAKEEKTELIVTDLNENNRTKLIPLIENDPSNKECFDCGTKDPEFISINNGVFICKICVANHNKFPIDISIVVKNDLNSLTENQLCYLNNGGNKKLLDFITYEYPQLQSLHPEILYKTGAMQYYRQKLKFLVDGKEEPKKPDPDKCYSIIQSFNSVEKKRKLSGSRAKVRIKLKRIAKNELDKYGSNNENSRRRGKKIKERVNINIKDNLTNESKQNNTHNKINTDNLKVEEEDHNKTTKGNNTINKQIFKKITNYSSVNRQTNYNTISNQKRNYFSIESKDELNKQKNNNICGKYSYFNSIKNSTSTGCDSNNNANYVYEQRGMQPIKIDKILNEKVVYYKPRPISTSTNKNKRMNSSYSSFYIEKHNKNNMNVINKGLKSPGIYNRINYFRFRDLNTNYLHNCTLESPSTQSVNINKLGRVNNYYKNCNIGKTNAFYESTLKFKETESNSNSIQPYNTITGNLAKKNIKQIESYYKCNNQTEFLEKGGVNESNSNNDTCNFSNSEYFLYKTNNNIQYRNLFHKLKVIKKPVTVNLNLIKNNKDKLNNINSTVKNIHEIIKKNNKKEEKNEENGNKEKNEKIVNEKEDKKQEKNKNNEKNTLKDIITGNFFINFNDIEKKLKKIHKNDKMKKIKKEFEKIKKGRKKKEKENINDIQSSREIQTKTLQLINDPKKQMTIINNNEKDADQIHAKNVSSEINVNKSNNIRFIKQNFEQNMNTEKKSKITINIPKEKKIIGFRVQKIERLKTGNKNGKISYSNKNYAVTDNKMNLDNDTFSLKSFRPFKITSCYSNNSKLNNSINKMTNNSLSKTGVYFKKKFNIRFSNNSLCNSVHSRKSSCDSSDSDDRDYFTSFKKLKDVNEKQNLPPNIRITKIDEVKNNGEVETKFLDSVGNFKEGFTTTSVEILNDK